MDRDLQYKGVLEPVDPDKGAKGNRWIVICNPGEISRKVQDAQDYCLPIK